jgi:drug/metabolite transporter (DMT)-like permease
VSAPGSEARAVAQVIAAALGFAAIAIFTILATREGTALSMVLLGRYVVGTIALLPALAWLGRNPVAGPRLAQLLIAGGIGQAIVATLSLTALAFIPTATLVFLFYTYPAWVTLIAAVRGLEPLHARKLTALGLSLAGLVMLVGFPGTAAVHPVGVVLALSSAIVYAVYIPVMAHLQRGVEPAFASLCIAAGVSVIFVVATLVRGEFDVTLTATAWGSILALGVLCTALAFRLFLSGLARLGSVKTSIISTVEPLFAASLAALVLDQPITMPVVIGGCFIVMAVLVLETGPRRPTDFSRPPRHPRAQ